MFRDESTLGRQRKLNSGTPIFFPICHVIPTLFAMSIDLEWVKLDASLASYLVDVLNRQLGSAERPSFIGPIQVTSLDFGSAAPDVQLVDLRDIYRDFLEDDEDESDGGPVKVTEGAEDEDGFEWVSRRAPIRDENIAFQHLPPHMRYGRPGPGPTDLYASMPSLRSPVSTNPELWRSMGDMGGLGTAAFSTPPLYRSPTPSTPFSPQAYRQSGQRMSVDTQRTFLPNGFQSESRMPMSHEDTLTDESLDEELPASPDLEEPLPPANPHPNLQMHFNVDWHSDLRITLTTSLLINYPSPMFMSLPIKLSVTGLVFSGEIAVAYEGERRRVHLCILDDMDPYGPAAGKRTEVSTPSSSSTPPETELNTPQESPPSATYPSRSQKQLPVGQRLLPSIFIESEIGQADKHVLKNVTRVEKFIQDVIRKTVEEELVFPNFHTLLMGEQQPQTSGP